MSFTPPLDNDVSKTRNKDDVLINTEPHDLAAKSVAYPNNSLHVSRTFGGAIRVPSPDPSLSSIEDDGRWGRNVNSLSVPGYSRHASRSPVRSKDLKSRVGLFWVKNKGLALVLFSQLFGTLMNVTTRKLEIEGNDG